MKGNGEERLNGWDGKCSLKLIERSIGNTALRTLATGTNCIRPWPRADESFQESREDITPLTHLENVSRTLIINIDSFL